MCALAQRMLQALVEIRTYTLISTSICSTIPDNWVRHRNKATLQQLGRYIRGMQAPPVVAVDSARVLVEYHCMWLCTQRFDQTHRRIRMNCRSISVLDSRCQVLLGVVHLREGHGHRSTAHHIQLRTHRCLHCTRRGRTNRHNFRVTNRPGWERKHIELRDSTVDSTPHQDSTPGLRNCTRRSPPRNVRSWG